MLLYYFIKFSILYNKIYNKFNNLLDIKIKIWEFYKEIIAKDIIAKFVFKKTYQCTECFKINWKKNPNNNIENNFYMAPACFTEPFSFTDTMCCEKLICFCCNFNIKCNQCNMILYNICPEYKSTDQGWNPIEGKKYITKKCWNCQYKNNILLTMNNCNESNKVIGKIVYNKNRYILYNNTRIIV